MFWQDLEIHICSMPKERRRGPQFFFAITEVGNHVENHGDLKRDNKRRRNETTWNTALPKRAVSFARARCERS